MKSSLRFRSLFALLVAAILTPAALVAQTARDTVLEVVATTSPTSPHVSLSWPLPAGSSTTQGTQLWRRAKGAASWGTAISLPVGSTSFVDSAALPGVVYEYSLQATRPTFPTTVFGAIAAGHDIPLKERRGRLILLVDDTMAAPLAPELARFEADLAADGWLVHRRNVAREQVSIEATGAANQSARTAERAAVRQIIQGICATAPTENWSLVIFGRVPVVFSGSISPDGHGSRAWPTDTYYADLDGTWTDSTVNSTNTGEAAYFNLPGDGNFDQGTIPSTVELAAGRVDMARLDGIPAGLSETEKLRRYLLRNHQFRRGLAPYDTVPRRFVVDDNFGFFGSEAFSSSGWRAAISFFGRSPEALVSGKWFDVLPAQSALLAYGCGSGSYQSISGLGTYTDFGTQDSKAVFCMFFGSNFGNWDTPNNILRAPLAGTAGSLGLASVWSGRGYFHLQHMALGDTIGDATRFTQNHNIGTIAGGWMQNSSYRSITYNLMGDPTLRLHSMRAPVGLRATSGAGGVTLQWTASPDALLGYHVYRSEADGAFSRISGVVADASNPAGSPITGTTWTDSSAQSGSTYTWLVKAVRREVCASGTYINQSLGDAVTRTHSPSGPFPPETPTSFSVVASSASTRVLSWTDVNNGVAATAIQRNDPATGQWQAIATQVAGVASFTDSAAPVGKLSSYRIRAENANGVSDWSAVAADNSLPGVASFSILETTVERGAALPSVPISRSQGDLGEVSANVTVASLFNAGLPNANFEQWSESGATPGRLQPDGWLLAGPLPELVPGLLPGSMRSAWLPAPGTTTIDCVPRVHPQAFDLEWTIAATDPGSATARSFHFVLYGRSQAGALTPLLTLRTVRGSAAGLLALQAFDGAAWQTVVNDVVRASVRGTGGVGFAELHPLTLGLKVDLAAAAYEVRYGAPGAAPAVRQLNWFQNPPGAVNGTRLVRLSLAGNIAASGYGIDDVNLFSLDENASTLKPATSRVQWAHRSIGASAVPLSLPAAVSPALTEILELALAAPENGLVVGYPRSSYVFVRDFAAASLPAPWTSVTMGPTVPDPGYAEHAGGAFGLKVRSADLTDTRDSLRIISRPVAGDFQFTARLHMDAALVSAPRAGLMARVSLTDSSLMDAVMIRPMEPTGTSVLARFRRASSNAVSAVAASQSAAFVRPTWLRLARSGATLRTYYSANGATWTEFSTGQSLGTAGSTLYVGMAAVSATPPSSGIELGTYARFDNVSLYTPLAAPTGLSAQGGPGSVTLTWNASAGATAYRIERRGPADTVFARIGETASTSWTDSGLTAAGTYTYRIYALNPAYESSAAEISAQATAPSPYAAWIAEQGFSSGADSGPLADPDADGFVNLLEYALGRDPMKADSAGALQIDRTADGLHLTLSFHRVADPELTYTVVAGDDLAATAWPAIFSSNGADNTEGLVTATDSEPLSAHTRRFLRLVVRHGP